MASDLALDPGLSAAEQATLRELCDTIVPPGRGPPDLPSLARMGARDLGIDGEIARLWAERFPVEQRASFRRLLRVVESRGWNLFLTGRPDRFSKLSSEGKERYLRAWGESRLGTKRQGFQSLKRLTTFLFYGGANPAGSLPLWSELGYVPAPAPRSDAPLAPAGPPPNLLTVGADTGLTADACIVGSGAGGAVIAAELARAGHAVILLESGPYRDRHSFTGREAESFGAMFQRSGILTTRDLAFQILAGETAGGSTTVNWMTCLRPSALVRREWEAAGMTGAAGPDFDERVARVEARLGVGRGESEVNPSNEVLRSGSARLGYALGPDYDLIDRNAVGCAARCDYCPFGCVYDAKRSTLVTYLADAFASGARMLCEARADRVVLEGDRAVGVEATCGKGPEPHRVMIRSRVVVVAAGAVQTPALLRRSGLSEPGIGQGLRLHPTTALLGEFPHPVEVWKGPMQTVVVRRFARADPNEHGPWLESAPAHPGIAALALPWSGGAEHKAAMARLSRTAATIVLVRDVAEGRVDVDRVGESRLTYRLHRRDRENLTRGLVEAARIHQAAGAVRLQTLHTRPVRVGDGRSPITPGELETFVETIRRAGIVENAVQLFSAHPTGSARIGTDPRRSAAGPGGECHGVRNLWVGDGSLFPTAPGVNPMISIMAVAHAVARDVLPRLAAGNP